jgi:hypothetical protein
MHSLCLQQQWLLLQQKTQVDSFLLIQWLVFITVAAIAIAISQNRQFSDRQNFLQKTIQILQSAHELKLVAELVLSVCFDSHRLPLVRSCCRVVRLVCSLLQCMESGEVSNEAITFSQLKMLHAFNY